MKTEVRRAVAYVAGRAVTGYRSTSVFDYAAAKYTNFSGDVSESAVSVFDFDARCHFSGSRHADNLSLYHYGVGGHVNLRLEANARFSGYDYSSGSHFNGSVNGRNIQLYDFSEGRFFNYSI